MPNFLRRAVEMAKAGVYNLRIHHDRVIVPLMRDWGIDRLDGLSVKAQEIQDKLLAFPTQLARKAEVFERRAGLATP
jgi:acyl-[acyl-carrier-protein] desaturase